MEFIRTIREKRQTQKQADIEQQAESLIRVSDFDDVLYISYNSIPLVPIEKEWTTKEIIQELSIIRKNYINSRMKETRIPSAVF